MEQVTQQEFKGRKELCDERFERDKARINRMESNLEALTVLLTKTAEMQSACIRDEKETDERTKKVETNLEALTVLVHKMAEIQAAEKMNREDHEERLRAIEARGGKWFDKIIAALIGAAVAGFVAYLTAAIK